MRTTTMELIFGVSAIAAIGSWSARLESEREGREGQYNDWWCDHDVEREKRERLYSIAHEPEQGGGKHCGDHCGRHLVLVGVGGHTNEEGEEIAVDTQKPKSRGLTTIIITTIIIEGLLGRTGEVIC
jgi:hypothetical protein